MIPASFTTDNLTTPLTAAEIKTSIYGVLTTLGVSTTTWKPGAVVRTLITAASIILAGLSALIALIARSGFLSTAEEEWAEINAREVYGVDRIAATFAAGNLRLDNSGGGIYALGVGDLIVKNSVTGALYRNTAPVNLGSLATNVIVPIQALEEGAASSAAPGEIDTLVTTLLGVTCTNEGSIIGTDAEEIDDLKTRAREKLGALSPNGPWDAYSYVAKSATRADGSHIGVTRVKTVADLAFNVTTYIATASGAVGGSDVTIVDEALQTQVVPIPVTATTLSATPVVVPVTYEVWATNTTGLTEAEIEGAIRAELEVFFANEPIGGRRVGVTDAVWVSAISAVIGRARTSLGQSLGIFRVSVTAPASDVALAVSEVPTLGAITATVHQVP